MFEGGLKLDNTANRMARGCRCEGGDSYKQKAQEAVWLPARQNKLDPASHSSSMGLSHSALKHSACSPKLHASCFKLQLLLSCFDQTGSLTSSLRQWSPNFLALGTSFLEDNFSSDQAWGGDCFRMLQVHYIYCALYFYNYIISSTSDHQALDSGGWGPLLCRCLCTSASRRVSGILAKIQKLLIE